MTLYCDQCQNTQCSFKYFEQCIKSILGPLLFLVYINDIVTEIGSNIRLFADDTSLYIVVDNPLVAAETLNADLEKISRWAATWLVTFNPNKSVALLLSRKVSHPLHPPLYMGNTPINEVEAHKHLCLFLCNDCSWHQHINFIKDKAWARINIMRRLKYKLDRKSLESIYISFIRPLLEYGDTIWDNCTQYEKYELDKIQNEAARIATGATKLVSLTNLYKEIGWESLSKRLSNHKLTLLYKMINHLTPIYLSSLIPAQVSSASRYNLRNAQNYQTIRARTNQYRDSFLPSTLHLWNNLPLEARQSNTLNSFKLFLKKDILPIPRYYYHGNRKPQILHSRLRTGCSALNLDLFTKNITDSPLCSCGSIENSQHYFFHCRNYQAIRHDLLNSISLIQNPSLHLLLYGDPALPEESNRSIFDHVHNYILKSRRF